MWPFSKKPPAPPAAIIPEHRPEDFTQDIREVLDIEYQNFPWPWVKQDFLHLLQVGGYIHISKSAGHVDGYICAAPLRNGWNLLTISVRKDRQIAGVGGSMVRVLKAQMSLGQKLWSYVADYNLGAQLFFRAMGFRAVKVKRDYFLDHSAAYVFMFEKKPEQAGCGGKHEMIAGDEK